MCYKVVKNEGCDNSLNVNVDRIAEKKRESLPTISYEDVNVTIENPTGYVMAMKKENGLLDSIIFVLTSSRPIVDNQKKLSVKIVSPGNGLLIRYNNGGFVLQKAEKNKQETAYQISYDEIIIFNRKKDAKKIELFSQPILNYLKISSILPFLVSRLTFYAHLFDKKPGFECYIPVLAHLLWLDINGKERSTIKQLFKYGSLYYLKKSTTLSTECQKSFLSVIK